MTTFVASELESDLCMQGKQARCYQNITNDEAPLTIVSVTVHVA